MAKNNQDKKPTSVWLSEEQRQALDRLAEADNTSRNRLIQHAIASYLRRRRVVLCEEEQA